MTSEHSVGNVIIALTNPKSPTNVGAVMRAAGCYQVKQVLYSGKRYARAAKYSVDSFKTDTQKAHQNIPLTAIDSFLNLNNTLENVSAETKIICVDLVEGATPLPHFNHPEQAIYIFGPEDGTINQEIINVADDVVYVPTVGCMNLAASVNVILYDRLAKKVLAQNGSKQADNVLIRKSRDTNNNVKVADR